MKRKHLILRCISLTLVLSILLLCPVSATNDIPISENKVSTSQDEAHASYEKLAKFLGFYDAPEGYTYPDEYAGCFINDANKLVICLTENTPEVRKKYVSACGDNVLFQSAEYSLTELLKTGTALTVFNGGDANVVVRYNAEKNKIRVFLDEDYSDVRNNIESYIAKGNVADVIAERGSRDAVIAKQLGMVEYVYTRKDADIAERNALSTEPPLPFSEFLAPGSLIRNSEGINRFTVGVWATKVVNGVTISGIVTCGHTFINRITGYDPNKAAVTVGESGGDFGTAQAANVLSHEIYDDLDIAFVTRTNIAYLPTCSLANGAGILNRQYGTAIAPSGTIVTVLGQRTGGVVGTICDQDIECETITNGYAVEFTGISHALDGDSGGPVFHTNSSGINYLVGFQSENFIIGNTYYSAVVNARRALNALNVTMYTGG